MRLIGKYRAIIKDVNDPEKRGRIKVECPAVYGKDCLSTWCLPCFPPNFHSIPPKNSMVWIEFEGGRKDAPIWTGIFYTRETWKDMFVEDYNTKDTHIRAYHNILARANSVLNLNDKNSGKIVAGDIEAKSVTDKGKGGAK